MLITTFLHLNLNHFKKQNTIRNELKQIKNLLNKNHHQ